MSGIPFYNAGVPREQIEPWFLYVAAKKRLHDLENRPDEMACLGDNPSEV